jgi:C1A family cysteine protease
MKIFVVLLACFCIANALSLVPGNHPHFEKFAEFMRVYNKQYSSGQEFQKRFKIFSENLARIDDLNAKSTGARYNVTKFADMTREEFRQYPCGVDKLSSLTSQRPDFKPNYADLPSDVRAVAAPPSFDWTTKGAVTPVKNQGQCGSCWAFSTIGNIEGVNFVTKGQLIGLSEQEEVDCSKTSYGCGGGWPFWAMSDILNGYNGVIDTEAGYPYTAEDGTCAESTADQGTQIKSYKSYCTEDTAACAEDAMASLMVSTGPLSACLDAGPMQFYSGGIDNPTDCDPSAIDHCITIVGYGVDSASGLSYWKIKNSWGTDWGENGYYYLVRGTGACGINKVITVAKV